MKTTKHKIMFWAIVALMLATMFNGGCAEESQRQADAEATRRAWSFSDYVPVMETLIPRD